MSLVRVIASSVLFQSLNESQLERIGSVARVVSYPADRIIFQEGDSLTNLYVVERGSVRLTMDVRLWNREGRLFEEFIKKAVVNVFGRHFNSREFDPLVQKFEMGLTIDAGNEIPSRDYLEKLDEMDGLPEALRRLDVGESPEAVASALEFVLEGLHLNRRLNRDRTEGRYRYRG